jgi:hypothetical protein
VTLALARLGRLERKRRGEHAEHDPRLKQRHVLAQAVARALTVGRAGSAGVG